MTTTNSKRIEVRAQLRASRQRMAQFIMAASGARLDDDVTMHDDHIVIGGDRMQCEIARAHFANVLKIDGVTVDADAIPEDPEWTCLRIPMDRIETAITKHA